MERSALCAVDGKMEMEGMGCSFLDEYIAVCERSLDWMSQHLHLPIRSYTCYHCSDGDDCNLRKVGEMELTVDDRGRPQGLPGGEEPPYDHIWKCIHCGFFDPDNLRSVRACTEKEMVKECASTAEVCGLIYFELKKRPGMF
ncbi:hypothetical protein C0J52_18409 [Blattella germanica]|nr:hypothetical protein C0J52_18409 [Blattella germanica]